ncbi:phosphatase PAP2 family protein [Antricoccus suffuscus]|uniref:phosphatase PAP2 family protein n=1 Tax=Antricoccus suffuscus TaxID=1629062 RepID=UPI00147497D4|nr:phosphatase PAP2 family protein [Antricoccus suffuscus]
MHPLPPRTLRLSGQFGFVVFVLMLVGYLTRFGPLLSADQAVLDALTPYAVPGSAWVHTQETISTIFGPTTFRGVALIVGVVCLARKRYRIVLFLAAGVGIGGLILAVTKLIVDRPRPNEAAVSAFSSSFPSGHALGVTVGVMSLLLLIWPIASTMWRAIATTAGTVVILAVGFSRLALAVHHLSDVLAGFGLGLAWVVLVYTLTAPRLDLGVRRAIDRQGAIVDSK